MGNRKYGRGDGIVYGQLPASYRHQSFSIESFCKRGIGFYIFQLDRHKRLFMTAEGPRATKLEVQGLFNGYLHVTSHEVQVYDILIYIAKARRQVLHLWRLVASSITL